MKIFRTRQYITANHLCKSKLQFLTVKLLSAPLIRLPQEMIPDFFIRI